MSEAIPTRMGDGERITMAASELREEIQAGTEDAAEKGNVPQLTNDDLEALFEIMAAPGRMVSVALPLLVVGLVGARFAHAEADSEGEPQDEAAQRDGARPERRVEVDGSRRRLLDEAPERLAEVVVDDAVVTGETKPYVIYETDEPAAVGEERR